MISWVLFKVELLIFGSNSSPLFLVKSFTVQLKVEIKRYKKAHTTFTYEFCPLYCQSVTSVHVICITSGLGLLYLVI